MNYRQLLVVTLLLTSLEVSAETEEKDKPWKGSTELGYVATSGNSETETLNLKGKVIHETEKWRQRLEGTALYAAEKALGTTAERYTLQGQVDYKFSERNYIFGLIAYENDKFSGYQYRISETIGIGRRVLEARNLHIDIELGGGSRQSTLDDGTSNSEAIARGAGKLGWQISETSLFGEEITVESGESTTITQSVTSLESRINATLSMKISYLYKHTSDVPPGVNNTDTETAVTLVARY